jgi:hypothetical protein
VNSPSASDKLGNPTTLLSANLRSLDTFSAPDAHRLFVWAGVSV